MLYPLSYEGLWRTGEEAPADSGCGQAARV